ncbi:MAG: ATP-grasp domain-containing protein [Methanotrichaceae archaeon]
MKDKSLAILADTYASPLFLNTLVREGIPAFAQSDRLSEEFKRYCPELKLLDKADALNIIAQPGCKLLSNSEIFLPCLINHSDPTKAGAIMTFKDKPKFRLLLSKSFPDYFFTVAKADELRNIDLPSGRDYVIKPSSGFSGTKVTRVNSAKDLHEKVDDLLSEVRQNAESLSSDLPGPGPALLSPDRFLIEEHIKGEEIACDAYFNSIGEPVILGIYDHPLLDKDDFRDILYYTSSSLVKKMHPRIEDFLRKLSSQIAVKNFPVHAEFRLQRNRLMPIEINPMKFGSFSISDLTFFAFMLNPYKYYYNEQKPDWKEVLPRAEGKIFYRVLSRMEAPLAEGEKPDHDEFAAAFPDLIGYCKLDTKRYPAFSIAFGRAEKADELKRYLKIDFRDYTE